MSLLCLLVTAALGRTVLVVGERYAPADHGAWPQALTACLDAAAPGRFEVADATSPGMSLRKARTALRGAAGDAGALVLVAASPRVRLALLDRLGWTGALGALLRVATEDGRTAALFGPWPAERVLVSGFGSIPDSYAGIEVSYLDWARGAAVARGLGVPQVAFKLDAAATARLPPPPAAGLAPGNGAWRDVPAVRAPDLGRIACSWVLGQR